MAALQVAGEPSVDAPPRKRRVLNSLPVSVISKHGQPPGAGDLISAMRAIPMESGVVVSTFGTVCNVTTIDPDERTRCWVATMNVPG